MRQAQTTLPIATSGRGLTDITRQINDWVQRQDFRNGLLTVFIRHTSASLLIQENADPEVRRDLERFFARLVPDAPGRSWDGVVESVVSDVDVGTRSLKTRVLVRNPGSVILHFKPI